ncbi:uncharacterized protein LOC132728121 isoform X1 [Ruditapes philippinarum]|uniref:uncharacterized protein LOC132728121 isoform X1 n=2 Tax=Ruditapes philippinarum TaxID=129788 RepID=UPI00295B3036|nr:uncharacterized protein LOC132728121 isoform X1 [Ruditapes philippinarum]
MANNTSNSGQDLNDKIHRSHLRALLGRTISGTNQDSEEERHKQGGDPGKTTNKLTLPRRIKNITPKVRDRGMEFVHETKDYNVAEFYEHFNNDLPKTVMVNQGFCGEIVEDTFDREQVLRVHAISKQRRVVAKFQYGNHHRLISIPVSYEEKLCVVKQGGKRNTLQFSNNSWEIDGKPKAMYIILKDYTLPLTVQFPKDHSITVGNQTVSTNNIPCMELVQTFDEVYLLSNFITDGVMSQEVVHVPLYLSQLRLAIVTGIKGQSKEKWSGYQQELDRAASYIEFDQEFGNPNIAEYDPSAIHSDATYSYVEPTAYSNFVSLVNKSPLKSFDNLAYSEGHKQHEDNPNVYEEIDNTARHGKTTHGHSTHGKNEKHIKPPSNQALKKELETVLKSNEEPDTTPQLTSFKPQPQTKNIHPPPPLAPKPQMHHDSSHGSSPALPERKAIPGIPPTAQTGNAGHSLYQNDVPRTRISPTMQTTPKQEHKPLPVAEEVKKVVREVHCRDDVAKLTIDEVTEYLRRLNLEKYANTFKNEQIDGPMLSDLDKDMLRDDFGMKGVEALRLLKFAKEGHVPN